MRSYTEDGYAPIPSLRLSDDEYGKGLQCFVPACADVVPIDRAQQVIYLARRATKPMVGWFWTGGRMAPDETLQEAVVRNFKRETGLDLPADRFELAAVLDYRWKDRAQEPTEMGCHTLGCTHAVELSASELAFAHTHLEEREYERGAGFTAFNRERLVSEAVFPGILDLYDHLFPLQEEVECGELELAATDARRNIREFEFGTSAFQDFLIKDGSRPVGQHFHRAKFEIFYFLAGGGTIRTARVNAQGQIVGQIKQFEVGSWSAIRIPPYHTHRFDLRSGTHFVAYSSEPFDAGDMIACPIE